jgi:hypothetical protein
MYVMASGNMTIVPKRPPASLLGSRSGLRVSSASDCKRTRQDLMDISR